MVILTILANGVEPLSYQWQLDGEDISGATENTLTVGPVTPDGIGDYRCLVRDGCDNQIMSPPFEVIVPLVGMTTQPAGADLCVGDTLFMLVGAVNALSYQWFKDNAEIPGATNFFFAISSVDADDSGTYYAVATGVCDSVASQDAVVEVTECGQP